MNKALHQIFAAVIALFIILAGATTYWMGFKSQELNNNPWNMRSVYHELSLPRGQILAADNTILAESKPSDDSFKYQRIYPQGPLYAPVTGYFSIISGPQRGLEASENGLLTGEVSTSWTDRLRQLFIPQSNTGANIQTSIEPKLQKLAYDLLGNRQGAVVAIRPSTGQILAMVSKPSYDPNALATHDAASAQKVYDKLVNEKPSPLINNVTSTLYPPGSTFKIIISATALGMGQYSPSTLLSSPPRWQIPGTDTILPNTEAWRYGGPNTMMPMIDTFAYSSNTAFAQLGIKLGAQAISEQASKFGFGTSIMIDNGFTNGRPMKSAPSFFPPTTLPAKLALNSIGQGNTTETPLQNVLVAAAVANKGVMMKPTLVSHVRGATFDILSSPQPSPLSTVCTPQVAAQLTTMMEAVINKEDPFLKIPGIPIAAKTGTAQLGIGESAPIDSWITGFAPANNPQIAVAVVIHDANTYGARAAGPIMRALMEAALK